MKEQVQAGLKALGLYQRLRASRVYDFYWWFADRRYLDDRENEVQFYQRLLSGFKKGDLIFDIGANHGAKTDIFLRLGARVVAVEPDESNGQILTEKFLQYRLTQKPLALVKKAISDKDGVELMFVDGPGSAKNTLSQKWVETLRSDDSRFGERLDFSQQRQVQTTTVAQLVREHGRPFFVKIDVEGFEPNVLRGMAEPVPYLSFEVNLPEFVPEGLECVEVLKRIDPAGQFNYAVELRDGLVLSAWVGAAEFVKLFEACRESSIEVFWRSAQPVSRA